MHDVNIINKYERLKALIEDKFSNSEIPTDVKFLYLLADLICEKSFPRFARRYGLIRLDPDFIDVAKTEWLSIENITSFEKECCWLWNQYCSEVECNNKFNQIAPPLNY